MAPKPFRPTAFCPKKGCTGTCPIPAVVNGFNKNDRAKCRICSTAYSKPADVFFWQYHNKQQQNSTKQAAANSNANATTNVNDKKTKAMEQEIKDLRKQLQEKKDNENKLEDVDIETTPDFDKKINDIVSCINSVKAHRPEDKEYLGRLEGELAQHKAKRLQTKPLATRQLNVTRKLEKARNHRTALQEASDAENKRHHEAMEKIKDDMQKNEVTIKTLEAESQELLKEVAGDQVHISDPNNLVNDILGTIQKAIPSNISVQPEGLACIDFITGALTQFVTQMQQASQNAEKAAQQVQQAIPPQPSSSPAADDDGDLILDEEDIDVLVREMVGEYDKDEETEEKWQQRLQRQKTNFSKSKAGIARLKTLKLKANKK